MQNNKIYIVGVDFSITSPSITILSYNTIGELLGVDSIMVAQNKKQCLNDAIRLKYDNIEWHFHLLEFEETKTLCHELRYQRISQKLFNKMIEMIGNGENVHIAIEDYSFGSNGRLTDIAECVSVFKQITTYIILL
jgi:hypothetical protein